jgi:hypothetical protein
MAVRVLQIRVLLFIHLISPFNMSEEEGHNNQTELHEKNFGGRPKSFIWGTYAIQGKKVSDGHYEATCRYCNTFWHKGSPQALEAHFANDCLKIPLEIKQLFLNRLTEKSEVFMANQQKSNKKQKCSGNSQKRITDYHNFSKLSQEQIHRINRAGVKAFVVCGIPWHIIENPFFIDYLKSFHPDYEPPSRDLLSGELLARETAVANQQIIKQLGNSADLTLCK